MLILDFSSSQALIDSARRAKDLGNIASRIQIPDEDVKDFFNSFVSDPPRYSSNMDYIEGRVHGFNFRGNLWKNSKEKSMKNLLSKLDFEGSSYNSRHSRIVSSDQNFMIYLPNIDYSNIPEFCDLIINKSNDDKSLGKILGYFSSLDQYQTDDDMPKKKPSQRVSPVSVVDMSDVEEEIDPDEELNSSNPFIRERNTYVYSRDLIESFIEIDDTMAQGLLSRDRIIFPDGNSITRGSSENETDWRARIHFARIGARTRVRMRAQNNLRARAIGSSTRTDEIF